VAIYRTEEVQDRDHDSGNSSALSLLLESHFSCLNPLLKTGERAREKC